MFQRKKCWEKPYIANSCKRTKNRQACASLAVFWGGGIRMSAAHLCKFLKIMHYNTIRDMGYLENRIQS